MRCRCVVPGCTSPLDAPSHVFPKTPERSQMWRCAVRCPRLNGLTTDQLRRYHVCHLHFEESSYQQTRVKRKLNDTAVPTLSLPTTDLENIATTIDLVTDNNPTEQKVYIEDLFIKHEKISPEDYIQQPRKKFKSDQTQSEWRIGQVLEELRADSVSQDPLLSAEDNFIVEPADTMRSHTKPGLSNSREHLETQFNLEVAVSLPKAATNMKDKAHSEIVGSPVNKRRSILGKETRSKNLTPKVRRLYQIAASLKRQNHMMAQKIELFKKRLDATYKRANNADALTKHLTTVQRTFFKMQLRNSRHTPKLYEKSTDMEKINE